IFGCLLFCLAEVKMRSHWLSKKAEGRRQEAEGNLISCTRRLEVAATQAKPALLYETLRERLGSVTTCPPARVENIDFALVRAGRLGLYSRDF
ncbi:hypothetical protein, partial [Nostoc sp. 'Peltigera malacea cyanobiont' DB3992]|uniref:hypothetical protein n=1 Tax=Nostoc sp. 'Peltigera malacea cyanobiont' DB3992 TaxID=1206980 RepID=UPI0015D4CAE7